MKLLLLCLVVSSSLAVIADNNDYYADRGTNAANVAIAGLDACRTNGSHSNTVPYLTENSYMTASFGVIGGVLKFVQGQIANVKFNKAMKDLNNRFDMLEIDMNYQFAQLAAYIDRKQFESDITDPTSILWGQMRSFAQWPNNQTLATMAAECAKETPWQIAMKLQNRLYGPDNTIMTQVKANQYSNSSFMATKDVVMSRIFQLMMVQSFCVGVEHGPNYDVSKDWQMTRLFGIYSSIVNSTISSRITQEKDYFQATIPDIVNSIVKSDTTSKLQDYADQLYSTLSNLYSWDRFGVGLTNAWVKGYIGGNGYTPSAVQHIYANNVQHVYVVRYWIDLESKHSRSPDLLKCLNDGWASTYQGWIDNIKCGQDFIMIHKEGYAHYAPAYTTAVPDSSNYVSDLDYHGLTSAVWGSDHRPTTVEYDLGFWERPISIQLMPYTQ